MNTVFVLGAGASVDAEVPAMGDFLDRAFLLSPTDPEIKRDFDLVSLGRSRLTRSQSKAKFDIRTLEPVFAGFEMATLFGRLGDLDSQTTEQLVPAMRRLIVHT